MHQSSNMINKKLLCKKIIHVFGMLQSKISPMGSGNLLIDISSSPIPKELWQLVDHLYKNALHEVCYILS